MRDTIEPGGWLPLATWIDGPYGAVLYVHRLPPGDFKLPGEEYEEEIEYLRFDPADGWVGESCGREIWPNPFDPPRKLLDKYKVFMTGVSRFSDGTNDIHLLGGLCCNAVVGVEIRDRSQMQVVEVDPERHTFLVGSSSPPARIRFLGREGQPILGHDGGPVELALES